VRDTIALLELRLALETEIAALAASRRSEHQLQEMSRCLSALNEAIEAGQDMISADFDFHLSLATATENHHFVDLMKLLGPGAIPRARLGLQDTMDPSARQQYLRRVQSEHESIFLAIKNQDVDAARAAMRTHLANSRERLRRVWEQAS
jgi:DNA-binding FadR family transcriptional regulator